jgi:hypothetical protein
LDVSLNWVDIQGAYVAELAAHAARAQALGFNCPPDVFEQFFHDHHDDSEMTRLLRFVDFSEVSWEEGALSGVALRHAGVPRAWQYAVDEARQETIRNGFLDERAEVMQHWNDSHTWIRAPVLLTGDLLQSNLRYQLIVGFTRLGNLLGALDRQALPEHARHRVWIGHR